MEPLQFTDKTVHYTILLAPFQPMTKIELETQVDSNAECYLDIRNPIDKTLTVRKTTFKLNITLVNINDAIYFHPQ